MTIKDINDIIKAVCPNDEDYEKPCISPKYLRQELEQLALEQEQKYLEQGSTTKNDLGVDREDAVIRLNALKQFIGYDKDSEIVKATQKSLDMAISALEHPERNVVAIVPCGDAISRSDVLKLMQDNWHTHNGDWAMQESMDDIRALPSVTPIRPKGHWIYDYTSADGHRVYHCSECGCYLKPKHSEPLNSFKWCSLCGADMREVEE